jgi:cell wall-associated NlpC family hydrolase
VLSLCLLFSWALWGFSSTCEALPPDWASSFSYQLKRIAAKSPRYVWGGIDAEKGLDCSGYVWLAAKWAAIPGIQRTTALRMSQGRDGWTGREVRHTEATETDLLFWTWKDGRQRPFGHVGVLMGEREAAHASERRGVVITPLLGSLVRDLVMIRRLTIGE